MPYYLLPVIYISMGLIFLAFRPRKKAIRNWFIYNFIGTGNLVYVTIGLVLFIFLNPRKSNDHPHPAFADHWLQYVKRHFQRQGIKVQIAEEVKSKK